MDKKQALIERNKQTQGALVADYYLNNERENPDPAVWDANGIRGVWQKLYENERYIAELEHKAKYYPPIDYARVTKEWITYPLTISVLQFETLRQGLADFKKEVDSMRTKKKDKEFKLFGYDSYLPLYQNLWGQHRILAQGIPIFLNTLANDCIKKIAILVAKKGSVTLTNALNTELREIEILRDKIVELSEKIKDKKPYNFEVWDNAINKTAETRAELDTAFNYINKEAEIDRFITDLDALPRGDVFNTRLAEFKEYLQNNRAFLEEANTTGWVNSSLKVQTAERKIGEYENVN